MREKVRPINFNFYSLHIVICSVCGLVESCLVCA